MFGFLKAEKPFTEAEELIMNNWNVVVANPEPARAGEARAAERLRAKHEKNKKIPDSRGEPSRQVKRQAERKEFKSLRSDVKAVQHKWKRDQLKKSRSGDNLKDLITS